MSFLTTKIFNLILALGQECNITDLSKNIDTTWDYAYKSLKILQKHKICRLRKEGKMTYISLTPKGNKIRQKMKVILSLLHGNS